VPRWTASVRTLSIASAIALGSPIPVLTFMVTPLGNWLPVPLVPSPTLEGIDGLVAETDGIDAPTKGL